MWEAGVPALYAPMRTETAAQRGKCSKSKQSMVTSTIPRLSAACKAGVIWSSRGQGLGDRYRTTTGNEFMDQEGGWVHGFENQIKTRVTSKGRDISTNT